MKPEPIHPDLKLGLEIIELSAASILRKCCEADQDDGRQNVAIVLIAEFLPAFDPTRGSLDRFLKRCIKREMVREYERITGRPHHSQVRDEDKIGNDYGSVERLTQDVIENPDDHLSGCKVRTLKAFLETDSITEMADRLGIERHSADLRLSRLRIDLRQIAVAAA